MVVVIVVTKDSTIHEILETPVIEDIISRIGCKTVVEDKVEETLEIIIKIHHSHQTVAIITTATITTVITIIIGIKEEIKM